MENATLDLLMDVAANHGGYIPTRAAKEKGLVPARLVTLERRGGLERIGHGLYRIPGYPIDRHDDLIRAVLWTNGRGAVSNETALGLYELAAVNPVAIDVTVDKVYRIERAGGDHYRVHRAELDERNVRVHEGVRVVDVATAIRGAISQGVGTALIFDAIDRARRLGWIAELTATHLRDALKA